MIAIAKGEHDNKKNCGCEHVHPDRVEIAGPPADHVLFGQESRLFQQIFDRTKEFPVKMRDIVEKVRYKMPDSFFGFQVFLPADMTIASVEGGLTIEAVFFPSVPLNATQT